MKRLTAFAEIAMAVDKTLYCGYYYNFRNLPTGRQVISYAHRPHPNPLRKRGRCYVILTTPAVFGIRLIQHPLLKTGGELPIKFLVI